MLNPRCKKHELADNEEDGKKVWPLEVQSTQIARSISKGISGNTWQDGDKQSKSEFSFLPFPCDFVEELSKDSFQESRSFELEFEIPVVCAPVVQQISVNGKLFKSIQHWRSLGALDFILSVIRNGYKILFISTPPPRRFTNNASDLKEADFVWEAILELLHGNLVEEIISPPDIVNPGTSFFSSS